ncbi:hypothetical protein ASZ90_005288 [hydrocarbon metagenome]|uniref:Uncharacterized protein n=1 Tax=hydrocarbon metagenome TaxID=938273 RepID=A0A0W8FVG5_9ZZZZ
MGGFIQPRWGWAPTTEIIFKTAPHFLQITFKVIPTTGGQASLNPSEPDRLRILDTDTAVGFG